MTSRERAGVGREGRGVGVQGRVSRSMGHGRSWATGFTTNTGSRAAYFLIASAILLHAYSLFVEDIDSPSNISSKPNYLSILNTHPPIDAIEYSSKFLCLLSTLKIG